MSSASTGADTANSPTARTDRTDLIRIGILHGAFHRFLGEETSRHVRAVSHRIWNAKAFATAGGATKALVSRTIRCPQSIRCTPTTIRAAVRLATGERKRTSGPGRPPP